MFQTRFHGRGGQGVVTAAELLSVAAFDEGKHAQAFPSFGSERTGAPVVAYCRISEDPIRNREPILAPDALVIQDATLLHQVELLAGVPHDAYLLINSRRAVAQLGLETYLSGHRLDRVLALPATAIAMKHLGKPVPNAVLLGGLAALTSVVSLAAVCQAVRELFPGAIGEANVAAATEAFTFVTEHFLPIAAATGELP